MKHKSCVLLQIDAIKITLLLWICLHHTKNSKKSEGENNYKIKKIKISQKSESEGDDEEEVILIRKTPNSFWKDDIQVLKRRWVLKNKLKINHSIKIARFNQITGGWGGGGG